MVWRKTAKVLALAGKDRGFRKADIATMQRSRRVYQAPDCPDSSPVSDADSSEENRKRNTNNDPAQPLTGPCLDSTTDRKQEHEGSDRQAESSSDSEASDNSSYLTHWLCCWRRRTDTGDLGETAF